MRVMIQKPKLFFDEILKERKISLKRFSEKSNLNYNTLKQYRRGDLTIPEEQFKKMLTESPNSKYWISNITKIKDNWGSIKGGKSSAKVGDMKERMKHARKFRKIKRVKIKTNKFFCEFYGLLLGDGCITKFKDYEKKERYAIMISGNKKLDSLYMKEIKRHIEKNYGIYIYYYEYKDRNVCTLSIRNKNLCLELNSKFDVPIGVKYNKLKISERVSELPWNIKKFFLRGLFDSDGSIYAKKSENYRYPIISIRSKNEGFLKEIWKLLKEQDYPAYVSKWNVSVRGIKNIKKWFKDIGSSNQRNFLKYEYFLKHKSLPPKIIDGLIV